jgi:FkbM family methyltransferase
MSEYPMKFSEKFNGVYHDPDRDHLGTFGQGYGPKSEYRGSNLKDQVVLDLGAHTGGLTCWALDQGAKKVISVEAASDNFQYLKRNVEHRLEKDGNTDRSVLFNAAAMGGEIIPSFVEFWLTPRHGLKGHGQGSLVPRRGRSSVTVQTVKLKDLLDQFNPTYLKVDIEGGEWTMVDELSNLPPQVKQLGMEVHWTKDNPKSWIQETFMPLLYAQGFKVVSGDKFMMANRVIDSNRLGCCSGVFSRE